MMLKYKRGEQNFRSGGEFGRRSGDGGAGGESSKGKEKAMSARLEQCGILVVSQRSEKATHTLTNTRLSLPPTPRILSPLRRVRCARCTRLHGHTHSHTHTHWNRCIGEGRRGNTLWSHGESEWKATARVWPPALCCSLPFPSLPFPSERASCRWHCSTTEKTLLSHTHTYAYTHTLCTATWSCIHGESAQLQILTQDIPVFER